MPEERIVLKNCGTINPGDIATHLQRDGFKALDKVKTLSGMLPICAHCKKIRDDQGYWNQVEVYIKDHSDAEFTHGICPDCAAKVFSKL